jgi:ATP-dependent Lon protease
MCYYLLVPKRRTLKMADKNTLPVLVTRGSYIFPTFHGVLEIGREQSTKAVQKSIAEFKGNIIVVSQIDAQKDVLTIKDIYSFGVLAEASIKKQWKDGTITVDIKGVERVALSNLRLEKEYYEAEYEVKKPDDKKLDGKMNEVINEIREIIRAQKEVASDQMEIIDSLTNDEPNRIIDAIAQGSTFLPIVRRQKMLEELDPAKRADQLVKYVDSKKASADIETQLSKKIKNRVDEQQREYYLREKLKAIKDELGDMDGEGDDLQKYRKRLEDEPFPENIKNRILQEINRAEGMPAASSESNITRTYIDWMMQTPWWQESEEKINIKHAREILDDHHYGLEKVKDRIIEYLAVKQNTNKVKGQIITLVGPPGVGKTSLAKSIADAMGRKFVKVSLGGVKDESEIRGHRKTYIGAMPGRIIQGMKKAGVKNPVFLLDEIDKMASDYRGDPRFSNARGFGPRTKQ